MKKSRRILAVLFGAALLVSMLCVPAFALTEAEVEAQVAASSKEAVTGNVLIWFLCAVAFLKVSQKIDSFMATLGVNVGRTGGSLMAEAMIAVRAVTMVVGGRGKAGASRSGAASNGTAGASGSAGMAGFFKGGLIGMAGRHITNSAVKTATTQTSAVHTAQSQVQQAAEAAATADQAPPDTQINSEVHGGNSSTHTEGTATVMPPQDGVIVTGNGAPPQAGSVENMPPAAPAPDSLPPQDGVILTGSEPLAATSPEDQAPMESIPADMAPPQDGVIITEGSTTIHAPQSAENTLHGAPAEPAPQGNVSHSGGGQHTESHTERAGQSVHTAASSEKVQTNRFHSSGAGLPTLGGMVFSHSLASGGSFANDVIGTVARGEVAGSITGDLAAQSLQSYLGCTGSKIPPIFSDTEIGRGRISGYVSTPDHPQPIAFGMYHADQYTQPTGDFSKVRSADGTLWYTQLAQDTVERKPYKAPDGTVAYHEHIVKKLPDAPKRKDRI